MQKRRASKLWYCTTPLRAAAMPNLRQIAFQWEIQVRGIRILWLLLGLAVTPAGVAATVEGLSEARVPVSDQGEAERARAMREALEIVILKYTGRETVLEFSEVRQLLDNPGRFLLRYQYANRKDILPGEPALELQARFDGDALANRLIAIGVPLWAKERPRTLIYVAETTHSDRQLLYSEMPDPLVLGLRAAAERRALPIVIPSANDRDLAVAYTDVWGVFEEPLLDRAGRAGANFVLAGRLFTSGSGEWVARWSLVGLDGSRESWEDVVAAPEDAAMLIVDRLAEAFAVEYALVAPLLGGNAVRAEISNVDSLADYGDLLSYLETLSPVQSVKPVQITRDVITLDIQLRGTRRSFERTLELGNRLQPVSQGSEIVVPLGEVVGLEFGSGNELLRFRYRK